MKTTHRNFVFLTLILNLPAAHATVTLTATDIFSASSGSNLGDLAITGDLSIYKGLDVGTTVIGATTYSSINIDWYNTAPFSKTASFDITDANATFQWRDNLAGGAAVRNKMTLNPDNVLSLYNAAGAAANITLSGNTGVINLGGIGGGISANGTPIFSLDSAGKVNFSNSGTSQNTNTTPSTSPSTGALTLAGGLGVAGSINTAGDSYFNGVRVGKGGGANISNTAVGYDALLKDTTGLRNTALGYYALRQNYTGNDNTVVGYGFSGSNTGSSNSLFGANASLSGSNSIVIGANAIGEGSNTTVIGNIATTKTRLFGETVSGSLSVSGGSHLGATAENLNYLQAGVTGSYYGPVKTGANFYQHDFLFTKTGDETTGDFTASLGAFQTIGKDLTVEISTFGSNLDCGSAHYVISGKLGEGQNDPVFATEYNASGGAADIELMSYRWGSGTTLGIKFNAKNDTPGQITQRTVQIKVSGFASAAPQDRSDQFLSTPPIVKVDSTVRPNGGTITKTITAAEIKLEGKVTITQPQGDISMGIYQ